MARGVTHDEREEAAVDEAGERGEGEAAVRAVLDQVADWVAMSVSSAGGARRNGRGEPALAEIFFGFQAPFPKGKLRFTSASISA